MMPSMRNLVASQAKVSAGGLIGEFVDVAGGLLLAALVLMARTSDGLMTHVEPAHIAKYRVECSVPRYWRLS